jgi:hypothetical protein
MAGNAGPVTAMSSAATNTPKNNTNNNRFRSLSVIFFPLLASLVRP